MITPVVAGSELRPLLHVVLRAVELGAFNGPIAGNRVAGLVGHQGPLFSRQLGEEERAWAIISMHEELAQARSSVGVEAAAWYVAGLDFDHAEPSVVELLLLRWLRRLRIAALSAPRAVLVAGPRLLAATRARHVRPLSGASASVSHLSHLPSGDRQIPGSQSLRVPGGQVVDLALTHQKPPRSRVRRMSRDSWNFGDGPVVDQATA